MNEEEIKWTRISHWQFGLNSQSFPFVIPHKYASSSIQERKKPQPVHFQPNIESEFSAFLLHISKLLFLVYWHMFSISRSSLSHLYLTLYISLIKNVSITICQLFLCSIASKNNVALLFLWSAALLCFYDSFCVVCFPMYIIFHTQVLKANKIILNGIRKLKHLGRTLMKAQHSPCMRKLALSKV